MRYVGSPVRNDRNFKGVYIRCNKYVDVYNNRELVGGYLSPIFSARTTLRISSTCEDLRDNLNPVNIRDSCKGGARSTKSTHPETVIMLVDGKTTVS